MSENTKTSNPAADGDRFPSLTALRNAHSEMLTLHREKGNEPEIIAKIEQLINKGRATGALLDSEDDRWAAQSLLDYWNSLLYRAGSEPPEAILLDFNPFLFAGLGTEILMTLSSRSQRPIPPRSQRPMPPRSQLLIPPQSQPSIPPQSQHPIPPQSQNKKILNRVNVLFTSAILLASTVYLLKSATTLLSPRFSPDLAPEKIDINYSPNGNSILTIREGTAHLWNLQGKSLSIIGEKGSILSAVFSPDSKLIATTEPDENIK
jgi:WD40 repeat protein